MALPEKITLEVVTPEGLLLREEVDEVVAPGEVVARALAEATRLSAIGSMPFRATKDRLRGRTIAHIRSTLDDDMRTLMSPAT